EARPHPGRRAAQAPRSRHLGAERRQHAALAVSRRQRPEGQTGRRRPLQAGVGRGGEPALPVGRTRARDRPRSVRPHARRRAIPRRPYSRGAGVDRAVHGGRRADPHDRLVDLPGGAEYIAGRAGARPRRDPDDALPQFRKGSGGGARSSGRRAFLRAAADRLPDGPVRSRPPRSAGRGGLPGPVGPRDVGVLRSMADLISRPIAEIAAALRDKQATAQELVEQAIARHGRFGERLHAYLLWTPDEARAAARAADAAFAAGAVAGPLQGLPVSIKDLFAAEGLPCFAGSSRRLPADPWERDGPLVATLRRQLGVITGKTHMVEFAFGGTGLNSHHGAPVNAWDTAAQRSPGGSSSGAGVSLLEGSALLAFGSDTAGSVRIPACMTGTVGLKLTLG